MSNEPNANAGGGGWEPIPLSEGYDGDATAFVHLPPEFMLDGVPLEAPGHGYVPPMIVPLTPLTPAAGTDPAATGQWVVQAPTAAEQPVEQSAEHDPHATGEWTFADAVEPDPHATGQWNFAGTTESADPAATGQWTIPVVTEGADASDDSGEYTTSMLAQYASSAPATLPGGAPAPWAVQEPTAEAEPEHGPEQGPVAEAAESGEPVSSVPQAPSALDALSASPEYATSEAEAQAPEEAPEEAPEAQASEAQAPEEVLDAPASTGSSADSDEHPHISYLLRVNGADRPVTDSWIGESLLYVLRERLGLAGAKDGCSQGECGACNVQVDGRLVASCLVPAATAAGSEVRTVEGLATDGEPSDVQRALARCGAVQCGYCVPGMAMTVHDLLEGNHAPTELETRQALCGNLCRCSGYRGVLDAVREVVAEREAQTAASADEARIPHQIPHPHDGGMA
ncbi:2Fe-2S iron-sulfur cluster-binding protein [Streptomyces sp. NPDC050848]|uniref:2Fe-2S iron-sulfur cluster-binding protein n=1 Tax=Streptomyces sp. NPDC050848 TaxID=3155791 RepID=UPI0033C9051D